MSERTTIDGGLTAGHARPRSDDRFRRLFVIGVAVVTVGYGAFVLLSPGPAEQAVDHIEAARAAVDAYRVDTGELPADLATLVAEDRLATERDNFGYNLIYRTFDNRFEIYSVGPDGVPATQDDVRLGRGN